MRSSARVMSAPMAMASPPSLRIWSTVGLRDALREVDHVLSALYCSYGTPNLASSPFARLYTSRYSRVGCTLFTS